MAQGWSEPNYILPTEHIAEQIMEFLPTLMENGITFTTILELAFHVRNSVDDGNYARVGISRCPLRWSEAVVWECFVDVGLTDHLSETETASFVSEASRAVFAAYSEVEQLLGRFGVTEDCQFDAFVEDFIDEDVIVSFKRR